MARTVLHDTNAQIYESGGFIFGKWRPCRIILYSDSRMDWFFNQKKLVGSITLTDIPDAVTFDGVTAPTVARGRGKPFVPKLIRANLLFGVSTAKYTHWFLFENKEFYQQFCDTVCELLGKQREEPPHQSSTLAALLSPRSARKARSPSVFPNKRREHGSSPVEFNEEGDSSLTDLRRQWQQSTGSRYISHTPDPTRKFIMRI